MSTLPPPPPPVLGITRPAAAVDPSALPGLPPRPPRDNDWRPRSSGLIPLPAPTTAAFMGAAVARIVTRPATTGARIRATLIDVIIYALLPYLVLKGTLFAVGRFLDGESLEIRRLIAQVAIALVVVLFVFWLRATAVDGASVGASRVGIRVVREGTMNPLGWARTIVRWLTSAALIGVGVTIAVFGHRLHTREGRTLGVVLLVVGIAVALTDRLWMVVDRRHRTLHDIVAGSSVIDLRS